MKNEMTNIEKIEALRKKAKVIIAVDTGMRMVGAPVIATLAVLGINKKFLGEGTSFKNHKTVAIAAESILASNALDSVMSAITKRILSKIAIEIDELAAQDAEQKCECGECTEFVDNIDTDTEDDDTFVEEMDDDIDDETEKHVDVSHMFEACENLKGSIDVDEEEASSNPYDEYTVVEIKFDAASYKDASCAPIVRHIIYPDGYDTDVETYIGNLASVVGEHTAAADDTEWDGAPANYTLSKFSTEYILANADTLEDMNKLAEDIRKADEFYKKIESIGLNLVYVPEYADVDIYNDSMLDLEFFRFRDKYDTREFKVGILYHLPDDSTDTSVVDIEENSPIDAVSEIFDIFQLVAGSENKVDYVKIVEVNSVKDDEDSDEENEETTGGNE